MKLLTYIQQNYGLARRTITEAIKEKRVFLDGEAVEWYSTILKNGQRLEAKILDRRINDVVTDTEIQSELIVFHKPMGYVCSKNDAHNKTIYRLIGDEYKNHYYIGRLDKDSRGMVMLTNDPKIVDQYEHPRNKIEKEYIVTVKVRDQDFVKRILDGSREGTYERDTQEKFIDLVKSLFTKGLLVDEDGRLAKKANNSADLLRIIDMILVSEHNSELRRLRIEEPDTRSKIFVVRMVLNEGKKRHIRRIRSAIGGEVLDLVRVRIGDYELGKLEEEESKKIEN